MSNFETEIYHLNITYMKELIDQIKAEYAAFEKNADAQLVKGNKAAGTRARKAALNLSKLMKDFRKVSVDAAK
jgi:Histone H1-like protein Hc1.